MPPRWTLAGAAGLLLELVFHLGNASLGAGFFLLAPARRAAQADAADHFVADLDRNAAGQRNHLAEHALSRVHRLGPLRPLGGGPTEGLRGIGFAPREFHIVRRGIITLQEHAQPPAAVDDPNRRPGV